MSGSTNTRLWRVAGGLAIAHVVLMLGSFSLQKVAPLGASPAVVVADHVNWSMTKGFTGGYLTAVSFLIFLVDASLIAHLLRGRTDTSRWLSSTIAASAAVYVALSFAGLADLGAALYSGHHGASVAMLAALVDVHWFSIYLATAVLGVFACAVAGTVCATNALPRWIAYAGFVVGTVCVLSVPLAGVGVSDLATLLWLAWFVGLAVTTLRRPRVADGDQLPVDALVA